MIALLGICLSSISLKGPKASVDLTFLFFSTFDSTVEKYLLSSPTSIPPPLPPPRFGQHLAYLSLYELCKFAIHFCCEQSIFKEESKDMEGKEEMEAGSIATAISTLVCLHCHWIPGLRKFMMPWFHHCFILLNNLIYCNVWVQLYASKASKISVQSIC